MKTSSASANSQNVPQNVTGEVKVANYPLPLTYSLKTLRLLMKEQVKFGLSRRCLEIMIDISYKWESEHQGSTLYYLTSGTTNEMIFTYSCLAKLQKAGMIEVVGYGKHNSRSYGPTLAGLAALRPLCSVA